MTDKDAPRRRLVAIDLATPDASAWKTLVPEAAGRDVLANVRMVANRFVTEWLTDAHEVVKLHALDGTFEREVALPTVGSIGGFSGKRSHTESFYSFSSFAYPGVVYHYDFATAKSTVFKQPTVDFAPADFETVEVFYPSKDGTKIPMFLTYKKGLKKDGQNPTIPLWLRRVQRRHDAGLLAGDRLRGWRWAASSRRPACAAAASTARRGTTPAAWPTSRTSSTTSSPAPST